MPRAYLAIPLLIVAAALYFAWQGLQSPMPQATPAAEEPPRYAITDAEWIRLGRHGEPEFRAEARAIDYYADESVRLRTVRLDALGGHESPWHIEAPEGQAPPGERRLLLSGGVDAAGRVADDVPVQFSTPRLWVDLLRREFHTEDPVALRTEGRRAEARGLRADFEGERVQLLNDVQVDYAPEG